MDYGQSLATTSFDSPVIDLLQLRCWSGSYPCGTAAAAAAG
jgi:hypothetical protein